MNQIISWLQKVTVHVIITTLIVVIPFFISGMLGYGNAFQAHAKMTTEYNSAEVKGAEVVNTANPQDVKENAQQAAEATRQQTREGKEARAQNAAAPKARNARESTQDTDKNLAENIREKLNLDEPLPPSTKKFLKSSEKVVDKTIKTTKEGLQDAAEQVTGKPAY
jgi:preprotein translocase subunit SecF